MKEHQNKDVKKLMRKLKISQFDLSLKLGVSEMTVYRMLRRELTKEEKDKIMKIIIEMEV